MGLYPSDSEDFPALRDALEKLQLNDSALWFETESSAALGFGFRCGYLGLLHMEIVQERLEGEFDLDLVTTSPSVVFKVVLKSGEEVMVDNPAHYPDPSQIASVFEPVVLGTIHSFQDHLGAILSLCQEKRGVQRSLDFHSGGRVTLTYALPLNEIVIDFYDKLKGASRGYASFDYEFEGYQQSNLVKLDLKINGEPVDALSCIIHRDYAHSYGKKTYRKDERPY